MLRLPHVRTRCVRTSLAASRPEREGIEGGRHGLKVADLAAIWNQIWAALKQAQAPGRLARRLPEYFPRPALIRPLPKPGPYRGRARYWSK